MSNKLGLVVLLVLALTLTACERAGSTAPTALPTAKGNFPKPLATNGGMGLVEIAASQTAAALTGVPLGTPVLAVNGTAAATDSAAGAGTATATSPNTLPGLATATPTSASAQSGAATDTPLPSPTPNPLVTRTKTPQAQPTVQTVRPATYTLRQGEFVFCLARRFDVDPAALLALNGLVDSEVLQPGTTLSIPSTGSFPGPRALKAHPATYTVQADDTIYGIACLYGDVDPVNIAAVNGLSAPYTLTTGAQIKIP